MRKNLSLSKEEESLGQHAQWLELGLHTGGSEVRFPVKVSRIHTWIAGLTPAPHWGERQLIHVSVI